MGNTQSRVFGGISVLAVLGILWKMRRDRKKRKAAAASGTSTTSGDKTKKKKKPGIGDVMRVLKLVWPKFSKMFSKGDEGAGAGYFLCLLFFASMRSVFHATATYVQKNLLLALYQRKGEFRSYLLQNIALGVGFAIQRNAIQWSTKNLALVWQRKLTKILHEDYFAAMNYYFVEFSDKVKDPDERIVKDVSSLVKGITSVVMTFVYSLSSGLYFIPQLAYSFGTMSVVWPFIIMVPMVVFQGQIAGISGREYAGLNGKLAGVNGEVRSTIVRTQIHSEAIAALGGSDVEESIIMKKYNQFMQVQKDVWQKMIRWNISMQFCYFRSIPIVLGLMQAAPILIDRVGATEALSVAANAQYLADAQYRMMLTMQAVVAAIMFPWTFKTLTSQGGIANRIVGLIDHLREMKEKKEDESNAQFIQNDNLIEFKNVNIVTPTGNALVDDLSFTLGLKESLLITGHNGSGKSSIFRCLGGLWNIPCGTITKPGGGSKGLLSGVFYVPQKPYQVLGTLADQLTYPGSGSGEKVTKKMLKDILVQVDLGYLADRPNVMTEEINWEEELSLGEKQRVAIARLIFRRPKFAILDECTSAVSSEMEIRLYQICEDYGITYITISHRPALQAFHDRMLAIGDGKRGWKITKIDRDRHLSEFKRNLRSKAVSSDAELSIKQFLDDRSKEYRGKREDADKKAVDRKDESSWAKLNYILKIGLPNKAKPLMKMFLSIIASTAFKIYSVYLQGNLFASALAGQSFSFYRFAISWILSTFGEVLTEEYANIFSRRIEEKMRTTLTKYCLDLYFSQNTFYSLKQIDGRILDPEQRISDDVAELSKTVAELSVNVVKPILYVVSYGTVLQSLIGFDGLKYVAGYVAVGLGIIRLLMPDYKEYAERETNLEGKFRYVHSRIRTHSESIAFFGGGEYEKQVVRKRSKQLFDLLKEKYTKDLQFGIPNTFFVASDSMGSLPNNLKFYLQAFYSATVDANETGSLALNDRIVSESVNQTMRACSELLDFSEPLAALSGKISRVSDLIFVLENLKEASTASNASSAGSNQSNLIKFNNVDLVTPKGDCLASKLNFAITPDTPLMVTGANAVGKSSLFRAMGALWEVQKGKIDKPCDADGRLNIKDIFLVPQRVYMVLGSLGDQVTYPTIIPKEKRTKEDEERMAECLKLVGIDFLIEREKGFDTIKKWEDTLSLGEQQRLAMSRLFFHKPSFGVLDECTSAVSQDVEEKLYQNANKNGITCITISQRLALEEFHTQELHLGANTARGWTLREIKK